MAFPQIAQCIVCEGARLEAYGKYTLFGFYGIAPRIRIAILDFSNLVTLCFFFVGGPASGDTSAIARVFSPSGQIFDSIPAYGHFKEGPLSTFIILAISNHLPGPGQYRVALVANDENKYETTFELVQVSGGEMERLK
jgi:hypothetical protein